MYPKSAASPEPIAIGAVVQISDGAVQTSGCTVRIKPNGVAEGNGVGTTAYSTDGIVFYTPTQAETNYTSFILIATKASCIPVSITVITTSSVTPGTVLLAPVTHTSSVVPTVTTLTNMPAIPSNWFTADGLATDAVTEIVAGVWNAVQATYAAGGSFGEIATEIAAILVDTGTTIPAQITALNDLSSADVTAAVPTALQNADALLNREMSSVSDTTARSPLNALRLLRNKYAIAAGTLTVTKENDTTTAWTSTMTTDAAANPITGSDPA